MIKATTETKTKLYKAIEEAGLDPQTTIKKYFKDGSILELSNKQAKDLIKLITKI